MGWLRKFIVNCIRREVEEKGIIIGGYKLSVIDGAFTILKEE